MQMAMLKFGRDVLLRHGVDDSTIYPMVDDRDGIVIVLMVGGTLAYSVHLSKDELDGLIVLGITAEFHGEWVSLNTKLGL